MKIEIHHHYHRDAEVADKLNLIVAYLKTLLQKGTQTMATLEEILTEVTEQTTKIDSIDVLLDGMRQQIADLIAGQGNIPPDLQAKIDAVFSTAQANTAKIDAAIVENTPA